MVSATAQQRRPYAVSEEQVRDLLQRLEERSDGFRAIVDISLEVSRLNGTPREDRLDVLVQEFESAVDVLEKRFDKRASTTADVERVLRAAVRVNAQLPRALADQSLHPDASLRERAQTQWALLKLSLSSLADFYDIQWRWSSRPGSSKTFIPTITTSIRSWIRPMGRLVPPHADRRG